MIVNNALYSFVILMLTTKTGRIASPTDRHNISALDFSDVVRCEQLVRGATHRSGNLLDLVLTDMRGIIYVETIAPL